MGMFGKVFKKSVTRGSASERGAFWRSGLRKFGGLMAILTVIGVVAVAPTMAYAADGNCVESSIIYNKEEDGKRYYCDTDGSGIYRILNIVVNVLTMGVGILGTLGVVIAGVMYMTAAGNEAQMTKAKKRILEVVLGLVVYGVMWVVMQWLIPGGVL